MNNKGLLYVPAMAAAALLISACATQEPPPPGRWQAATEAEVAAALDGAVLEAARELVWLKKDGKLMFCKRFKQIGSNLPTITCITEAQLRERVQNMENYKDDMRNRGGKCTLGSGCTNGDQRKSDVRW